MALVRCLNTLALPVTLKVLAFPQITKLTYGSSFFITCAPIGRRFTTSALDNGKKFTQTDLKELNSLGSKFFRCNEDTSDEVKTLRFTSVKELTKLIINRIKPDVKLELTNGESFLVHSLVLSTRSKVFHDLLSSNDTSVDSEGMTILKINDDIDEETSVMTELISFMYSNQFAYKSYCSTLERFGSPLYYLARKYEIPALIELCEVCLVGNVSGYNVLFLRDIADNHNIQRLRDATAAYIDSNPDEVLHEYALQLIDPKRMDTVSAGWR